MNERFEVKIRCCLVCEPSDMNTRDGTEDGVVEVGERHKWDDVEEGQGQDGHHLFVNDLVISSKQNWM